MPMFSLQKEKYISKVEETNIGKIAGKHIHTHKILRTHIGRETRRRLHPTALEGLARVLFILRRFLSACCHRFGKVVFSTCKFCSYKIPFPMAPFQVHVLSSFSFNKHLPSVYVILKF